MPMTRARARQVRDLCLDVLQWPADAFTECDECHGGPMAVWVDPETRECGEFEYCRQCWEARLGRARKALQRGE
jgi:hypothetical protein